MLSNETLCQIKKESKIIYYLIVSFITILGKNDNRELGKILANANEDVQKDWINSNTILETKKRDDQDLNGSGFDLITVDNLLTINSKIRVNTLHLENTRRKSGKNKESSKNGHVAYSVGESDVYLFSRPKKDEYSNLNKWEFIAIPEKELIDPKNPKYLVTNVSKKLEKKYIGKTKETLENIYQEKLTKSKIIYS
jgi:hypothetical protein